LCQVITCLYTYGMNPENSPVEITNVSESPKKSKLKMLVREIFIFAIIAFGIVLPFRLYIAEPYIVEGASMDPTFKTGDYLIVDKLSYELGKPERNSVVVFKFPEDPRKSFIKRVIGLPGETVVVKSGSTTIINSENPKGFAIDQLYVKNTCTGTEHNCISSYQKTLAGDEYFVMGDNRAESFDSRSWGPLSKKYILGKPVLRLYPLNKIEVVPGTYKK